MVRIKVLSSDCPFQIQLDALDYMYTKPSPFREVLLSNQLSSLPAVDLYADLGDNLETWVQSLVFNPEQLDAFRALRNLSGGVGVIHGPPVTGKTFWLLRILLPIVITHPKERRQVMILGPSNNVADHLALGMQSLLDKFHPNQGLLVTRCHSMSSEEALVAQSADSQTKPKPSQQAQEMLFYLTATARMVADLDSAQSRCVQDGRMKLIPLSLGYRMLELAGIIERPWSERCTFRGFRQQFHMYQRGEDHEFDYLEKQEMEDLPRSVQELRNAALARSDVVICTPFTAGMPAIRKNVRPTVIAVDEATRLMEPELWSALAWYTPRAVLLIGDHRQLRPLVFTRPAENPFSPQPGLSLFTCLVYNGHMDVDFLEQQRMVPELCALVSDVFYESRLRTANNLRVAIVQTSKHIVNHNSSHSTFGKAAPLIFVDVKDSKDNKDVRGRSLVNYPNCTAVSALIKSLVDNCGFDPGQIAVLSPYRGQVNVYQSLCGSYAALRRVRVETVDSFQGCESMVVILDTTACTRLAFLADANRLCVALSRAQAGLYIVGCWERLNNSL